MFDTELEMDNISIENQKEIIAKFVRKRFSDAKVYYFEDRDKFGYTFEQRTGYQNTRVLRFSNYNEYGR